MAKYHSNRSARPKIVVGPRDLPKRWHNKLINFDPKIAYRILELGLRKEPKLTKYGIGQPTGISGVWCCVYGGSTFSESRRALEKELESVAAASMYLLYQSSVNCQATELKKNVEKWFKIRKQPLDLSLGSLMAAALGLRCRATPISNSTPNATIWGVPRLPSEPDNLIRDPVRDERLAHRGYRDF